MVGRKDKGVRVKRSEKSAREMAVRRDPVRSKERSDRSVDSCKAIMGLHEIKGGRPEEQA